MIAKKVSSRFKKQWILSHPFSRRVESSFERVSRNDLVDCNFLVPRSTAFFVSGECGRHYYSCRESSRISVLNDHHHVAYNVAHYQEHIHMGRYQNPTCGLHIVSIGMGFAIFTLSTMSELWSISSANSDVYLFRPFLFQEYCSVTKMQRSTTINRIPVIFDPSIL